MSGKWKNAKHANTKPRSSSTPSRGRHGRVEARKGIPGKRVAITFIIVVLALLVAAGSAAAVLLVGKQALFDVDQGSVGLKTIKYDGVTYEFNPDVTTILFLGIDKDNERTVPPYNGQADAIMAIALNEQTGKMTCLAVPRTSWTPIVTRNFANGQMGEETDFLCLGFNYGYDDADSSELMCQNVSFLLKGVPVDDYFTMNMSGVGALADAVGGVELTALYDVAKTDIKQGDELDLFGNDARDYVWQRDTAVEFSSVERLERQEQFAKAFAVKALEQCKSNPLELLHLFQVADEHSITNLGFPELSYLAFFVASHGLSDVEMTSLPGTYATTEEGYTKFTVNDEEALKTILDIYYREA